MALELIDRHRSGCGLERELYTSAEVFAREQECIFRRHWVFAGHSCEMPNPGDFLTYEVGGAPLIVIRDSSGNVQALHNVCRHRGSIICTVESGSVHRRLVCPYHSWSYDLDGTLRGAPHMGNRMEKAQYSLKRAHAGEFSGLIFVCLADTPSPLEELRDHLAPILAPQGMARGKIAVVRDYVLDVNWKLVIENNRECYHCPPNHHGYVAVQYDTENDNPAVAGEISARLSECMQRWAAGGLDVSRVNTSSDYTSEWLRANRTPVRKGMVTESPDGQAVCSVLMGGFTDPDMGTARANTNTNFWCHANSDYAHTVRITPLAPARTVVRGYWLVDAGAVAGKDYDPSRVAAFHDTVMAEDWEICRRQWRGIQSPAYEPGPYSPTKEQNVMRFIDWYLRQMAI